MNARRHSWLRYVQNQRRLGSCWVCWSHLWGHEEKPTFFQNRTRLYQQSRICWDFPSRQSLVDRFCWRIACYIWSNPRNTFCKHSNTRQIPWAQEWLTCKHQRLVMSSSSFSAHCIKVWGHYSSKSWRNDQTNEEALYKRKHSIAWILDTLRTGVHIDDPNFLQIPWEI